MKLTRTITPTSRPSFKRWLLHINLENYKINLYGNSKITVNQYLRGSTSDRTLIMESDGVREVQENKT